MLSEYAGAVEKRAPWPLLFRLSRLSKTALRDGRVLIATHSFPIVVRLRGILITAFVPGSCLN
jgi:hypothetical protein